jgi:hypothetical protein
MQYSLGSDLNSHRCAVAVAVAVAVALATIATAVVAAAAVTAPNAELRARRGAFALGRASSQAVAAPRLLAIAPTVGLLVLLQRLPSSSMAGICNSTVYFYRLFYNRNSRRFH